MNESDYMISKDQNTQGQKFAVNMIWLTIAVCLFLIERYICSPLLLHRFAQRVGVNSFQSFQNEDNANIRERRLGRVFINPIATPVLLVWLQTSHLGCIFNLLSDIIYRYRWILLTPGTKQCFNRNQCNSL